MTDQDNELKLSEERLKMVLEGSQQGYWDWNIETGEVQRNERWAQMLGYKSIKEFEDNTDTWTDNIHPDDRDAAWKAINDHLEGRSPAYRIEYRMIGKDGQVIWTLDQAKIVKRDAEGRPLRMSGTHTDISEQKRSEAKILEQSNLLEMLYKHTHDGIVLLDKEFNFIRVNEAYAKSCARDVSEFPGHNHFEYYPSELIKDFELVVKTKQAYNILARPFEFPDYPEWGTSYWDLSLIPILDDQDDVEFLLFTLKDVTSRKLAEQEKDQLQTQLLHAQKMESIGQLTGGMAHDFNNILAAILGYTELCISEFSNKTESRVTGYLNHILRAGERGRDLISKMLTFTRSVPVELKTVDCVSLVNEVVDLLRPTLPSSINIEIKFAENKVPLQVDSVQLHQVLTNLIINAHHATGEYGTITLLISEPREVSGKCCSCHKPFSGNYVEISIRDDGPGMSGAVLERIFEPFFTTKEVGKGSGMGLPMVHGILHSRGGHVIVESKEGEGTNFRLFFPPAQDDAEEKPLADVESSDEYVKNKHIMVIDDEEGITGFLSILLKNSGYRVSPYNNPIAAINAFKSNPETYDLVITDQTMPKLSGLELSEKLLTIKPGLPIILCTGYSEKANEVVAKEVGIIKFMEKPVNTKKLLNHIKTLLTK